MDELKDFKKKLELSNIRFESIARTATDSIIISDEDSFIVFANKKSYDIFGYKGEELKGLRLEMLMPEKYRKAHVLGVERFIKSGTPKLIGHTIEIEGLRKNGSVFPLELSLSSWKEGGKYFFSGIIRDISKRKQSLKEKEEASQKLQEKQKELEAANEELLSFHEELQAANEELQASQEELKATNKELLRKEQLLKEWNSELEKRVQLRTRAIEQQREWLHNLFMQVPALIGLLKGREGVISLANSSFSQLWGKRELLGKTMRQALPELEGQGYFELVEGVYDSGESVVRTEYPALIDRHNNGRLELAFFNFVYAPFYDTNGEVEGVLAYGEDVSRQVHARKVVEESAERFRFMANAMPQKVWTAKEDGETDYFNEKWLDYTGLSPDKLKGWGWKSIIHPDDWEENERVWLHSIRTGQDFQLEHRFKRKDGAYRWHLSRGLAQCDESGKIKMWVGTSTDIHDHRISQEKLIRTQADLKKSNEELLRVNNDLDNFIYTASHDLKSPIVNMEGLIDLIKKKVVAKDVEKTPELIGMMEASVLRLKKTIVDLAEITKVQKESIEPSEHSSFEEILQDVKADLFRQIEESSTRIKEEFNVRQIFYTKKNLRSIIYNLLSNAIKYRSDERSLEINIRTYRQGEQVVLSVEDNGVGLSEQQLPKLFTMFKRFHSHVEGTGIGLYIVKRMVENNGGRIEVRSREKQGTVFEIYF